MRSQIIVFYFYFKQLYFKRLASRKAKKAHKNKVIFLAEKFRVRRGLSFS